MRTSRLPSVLIFLALAATLMAPPARASRLPDWAKEIADTAPPAPEGVPPYPSRVLFSEMSYSIQPDGSMKVRRRFAEQALSSRAGEIGVGTFAIVDTMKITGSKAWHVPPGERASRSWGAPADIAANGVFLSDTKVRVLTVKDIKKGSLVFYEFEGLDKPRMLPLDHVFYEGGAPVLVERFRVEAPQGWTVKSAWLRQNGPDPAVEGNVRTWEMRDLPAADDEPLSQSPEDRAPMLVVNPVPPSGAATPAAALGDWKSFSLWYEDLEKGRHDVTPAITAAAKKALDGSGPGFFDKVKAAGTFVRDKVRYVAVELGIGGFQPHPAAETLSNLYGDCKDKSTLFRAFLAEEGLESYPVLINLTEAETVSEQVPGNGFNHLVVAVPVPEGEVVPPAFAPATVEAGDLGRLLIVDTTDDKTTVGSLSADLGGKRGLVVAAARGRVITLPSGDPSVHELVRHLTIAVQPDRSIAVTRESRYLGDFAWHARVDYSSSSAERRKGIERRVMQIWPDASVSDYAAEYETPEGAFVESVKFRLRALPTTGSGAKIEIFPGASEDVERVPLGKRKSPVEYEHAETIRYEVAILGAPASAQLPSPQSATGDGWSVKTTYARDGDAVKATWEIVLTRTRFPSDAFPELKKFWSAMASAAGWVLNLAT